MKCFFTLKKLNDIFMLLKSMISWQNFKSQNMAIYCKNFCFFSPTKPPTHNMFTTKFGPLLTNKCLFLTCWLFMDMMYYPTTHPRHATLHFHLLVCFYKLCFNTKFFSLPLISLHILQHIRVNARMSGTIFGFFERK
jgi:hypothetical protein